MKTVIRISLIGVGLVFWAVPGLGDEQPGVPSLKVGLASVDITPEEGAPIYRGEATGVRDRLHAKAMVLHQGETSAALLICDLLSVPRALSVRVRSEVAETTGIPFEHIGVAATHTHTGPRYHEALHEYVAAEEAGELTGEQKEGYIPRLMRATARAGIEAHEAATPVSLQVVRAEAEGISFNRRFLMKSGRVRFNPGSQNPDIVRPVGPIDPEVLTILCRADDGKPLGGLTNFANHLDTVGGTDFSADYPYFLERSLREELDESFLSLFGLGTAGDLNHFDVSVPSRERLTTRQIGEALGAAIRRSLEDRQEQVPSLAAASRTLFLPMQGYTDEELDWAKAFSEGEAGPLHPERPFLQRRRAMKILSLEAMRERRAIPPAASGEPWMLPVEIQAFRLTDRTAIVTMPGEVFVELGLELKERSPFEHTLPIELANANIRYVPTRQAFRQGDYEAINSRLAPGGGEAMIEAAVGMLEGLAADIEP